MNPNAGCLTMTDAMERFDFLTAREREIALALRDRFAADGITPDDWTPTEFARLSQAVLARTAYPD